MAGAAAGASGAVSEGEGACSASSTSSASLHGTVGLRSALAAPDAGLPRNTPSPQHTAHSLSDIVVHGAGIAVTTTLLQHKLRVNLL